MINIVAKDRHVLYMTLLAHGDELNIAEGKVDFDGAMHEGNIVSSHRERALSYASQTRCSAYYAQGTRYCLASKCVW